MTTINRWARAFAIPFALILIILTLLIATAPRTTAAAPSGIQLGADLIGPGSLGFDYHMSLFRRMDAEIVRLRVDKWSGMRLDHIDRLIDAGAKTIILAPDGCDITPATYRRELIDSGIIAKAKSLRSTAFVVEVGNEPDICADPVLHPTFRNQAITVYDAINAGVRAPNITWAISLPVWLHEAEWALYSDSRLLDRYDAIATHIYGCYELGDNCNILSGQVYQSIIDRTDKPVYITEMGIGDHGMDAAEKANRMLAWIDRQDPARLKGVTVFYLGDEGTIWDQSYRITEKMADTFAARDSLGVKPGRYVEVTDKTIAPEFVPYYDRYGGVWMFGYPLSDAYVEPQSGLLIQVFERMVLEYHPQNAGTDWAVMGRHLGREWMEGR